MKPSRLFLLLSALILATDLGLVLSNQASTHHAFRVAMDELGTRQRSAYELAYRMEMESMLKMATFLAQDQEIQQLFLRGKRAVAREGGGKGGVEAARARADLLRAVGPAWDELREQFHVRQFHFHLGPGSLSFLRVHKPAFYGDRMDDLRHIIVDTNADHIVRHGFETGRVYSGIRGVVPVFARDPENGARVHVGSMEVGTSFKSVLRQTSQELGSHLAILLRADHVEASMWPNMIAETFAKFSEQCHCVVEATTNPRQINQLLSHHYNRLFPSPDGSPRTTVLPLAEADGHAVHYAVTHFPLLDYRARRDGDSKHVGRVFIWTRVNREVSALHTGLRNSLLIALLGFLLVEVLLYFAIHWATGELQRRLDNHAAALRESEELLHEAQAVARVGSWYLNIASGELAWSEETYRIFGVPPATPMTLTGFFERVDSRDREAVRQAWQNAVAGDEYHIEHRIQVGDETRWVAERARLRRDADGTPIQGVGTTQDITQRKNAEIAQRESRKRLRDTMDALPLWVALLDREGFIQVANHRHELLVEPDAPLEGTHVAKVLPEHPWTRLQAEMPRVLQGETVEHPDRFPTTDGPRHLYAVYTPVRDDQEAITGLVVCLLDITEQRRAEQARESSEAWTRAVLEQSYDSIFITDDAHAFLLVNQRFRELTGFTREALLARTLEDVFPDWIAMPAAGLREMELLRHDGVRLLISLSCAPVWIEGRQHWLGVARDITQQKLAERMLQRWATVFQTAGWGIAVSTPDHEHLAAVNPAFARERGYTPGELVGKPIRDLFPRDEPERVEPQIRAAMRGEPYHFETIQRRKDGSHFVAWVETNPVGADQGEALYHIMHTQDITQRKRTEQALRRSEARLRRFVEGLNAIVWEVDLASGRFTYVSPHAETLLGYPVEAWKDLSSWEGMIVEADRAWATDYCKTETALGHDHDFDYRMRHAGGGEVWLRDIVTVDRNEAGEPETLRGIMVDIGEAKRLEQQLRTSERRFRDVLETVPMIAVMLDPEGRITFGNEYLCNLTGWRRDEITGRDWFTTFLPEHIRDETRQVVFSRMRAAEPNTERYEHEILVKSGERRLIQWYNFGLRDEHGHWVGSTKLGSDITEQRGAENALLEHKWMLQEIIDSSGMLVFLKDFESRFILVNRVLAELVGVPREDCLGKTHGELFGEELARTASESDQQVRETGERLQSEVDFNRDGREYSFLVTKVLLRTRAGEPYGICGVAADISERKRMERELQRAKDQAEAANRAKSAFLTNMSHELRTPLNAVMGFAQILQADTGLSIRQQEQITAIHRGGHYLLTLINDILDLAKIEAGRFEIIPKDFHLPEFLATIREMFEIRAAQKDLAFHFQPCATLPSLIRADEKRLRQVLMNLLGNAIKFTEQGHVRLTVCVEANILTLEIEDTGIGIPESDQERVFEPFRQSADEQYRLQGTGLGLAITRTLIAMMAGRMDMTSTPGQGTRFALRLPFEAPTQPRALEPAAARDTILGYHRLDAHADPLRVLVVDDHADNRKVPRLLLEDLGFVVREADSGEACLALVEDWVPDVVLLDLRMPGMDGLATARALRARPRFASLPLIAVSASIYEQDQEASRHAGCNRFLAKPLEKSRLFAALADLLPLAWREETVAAAESIVEETPFPPGLRDELIALTKKGAIKELTARLETLAAEPRPPLGVARMLGLARTFNLKEVARELARQG